MWRTLYSGYADGASPQFVGIVLITSVRMDDKPVDWILDCEFDVVVDDDEQERVPESKQCPEDGLVDVLYLWGYEDFMHGYFADK